MSGKITPPAEILARAATIAAEARERLADRREAAMAEQHGTEFLHLVHQHARVVARSSDFRARMHSRAMLALLFGAISDREYTLALKAIERDGATIHDAVQRALHVES